MAFRVTKILVQDDIEIVASICLSADTNHGKRRRNEIICRFQFLNRNKRHRAQGGNRAGPDDADRGGRLGQRQRSEGSNFRSRWRRSIGR